MARKFTHLVHIGKTRLSRITAAIGLAFVLGLPANLLAADPELVGILADAVNPAVAESIGLSESQLEQINGLIRQQESRALDLADKMRDLPSAEREQLRVNSIKQLEKEAYRVLTLQQRSQLERIRLNRVGLKSLNEPQIAETLSLSEGQREQIQAVFDKRVELLREHGAANVESEMQKQLRKVLTDVQFATWQAMAGGASQAEVKAMAQAAADANAATAEFTPADSVASDAANETTASPSDLQPNTPMAATTAADEAEISESSAEQPQTNDIPVGVAKSNDDDRILTLNFNGTEWSTVLKWIAEEAELSLQIDTIPPGTFTYKDPYRKYSVAEALDQMNGVLLGKGYTLVRRQRTLMVIDLGSGQSAEVTRSLVRELAQLVTPDQLDDRGDFEILKCLFVLSRMSVEDAEEQVRNLIGPQGSVIPLASSGQLLVVETGEKLRMIRDSIEKVENPEQSINFLTLEHVSAEEVLSIARPLLGIPLESNTAEGINIATDAFGNTLIVTGTPEKMQMLRDIIKKIDVVPEGASGTSVAVEKPEVKTHPVRGSDPQAAMDVLQTLLAGTPNVRLALDSKTNRIIASATPTEHALIVKTLEELAGQVNNFEIIPLSRMEPAAAITTLEKLFGKASSTDAANATGDAKPIFYGDLSARTLMVKGTKDQVEQVRGIIAKIEESGPDMSMLGSNVKVFSKTGRSADRFIEQLQLLYETRNPNVRIKVKTPTSNETAEKSPRRTQVGDAPPPRESLPSKRTETSEPSRTDAQPQSAEGPKQDAAEAASEKPASNEAKDGISDASRPLGKLVQTDAPETSDVSQDEGGKGEAEINVIQTPSGLIVTSDDPEQLAEFEQLAMLVENQMASGPVEPTIFYLKYVPADAAAAMLKQVLSGQSATSSGGGGLLGSVASNVLGGIGGGLVGGLLGGGSSGGSISSGPGLGSGEVSIIPDQRLNFILVYANPADLELIDQLLRYIDSEDSPILVQTRGRPQPIPVVYSDATEVANIVKEVFADRIGSNAQGGGGGGGRGGNNQQPSPQDFIEALRGGGRGGNNNQQAQLKEQTMTVSVDSRNNTIYVMGPTSLYEQVRDFVEYLDQGSADSQDITEVVTLGGNINPAVVQTALLATFGAQAKTNLNQQQAGQTPNAAGNNQQGNQATSPADIQRRIQQFQQMRNAGGGFGGRTGGGFGGGAFGGGAFGGGNFGGFGGNRGGAAGGATGGNRGGGNRGGGGR